MKKITFLLLSILAMWGCDNEYVAPGEEPSHSVIFTSEMDFGNKIQVNDKLSFGDVSPGVVSRKWSFPQGVDILESDNDSTSADQRVKTVFTKAGTFQVRLNQQFKAPAYINGVLRGTENDTIITVRVIDSVRVNFTANFVNKNGTLGAPLTIKDQAKNEITAGTTIRYTAVNAGEPERLEWALEGGAPLTSEVVGTFDVKYKKVGVYDIQMIGKRSRPFGADTIALKQFLRVVPSTEPVTLDGVTSVPAQSSKIALNFSRDMDILTANPSNFSVAITNKGKSIPVTITAATVDPAQENVVLLTLSDRIFNNDEVAVSYAKGLLATSDGVAADAFEKRKLSFVKKNLLEGSPLDIGFENSLDSNWPYLAWGAPWDAYKLTVTNEEKHSGAKSAKIELKPNGGMVIGHKKNGEVVRFKAERGKIYEVGFWIKVKSLGDNAAGKEAPNVIFFWEPNTNWGAGRVNLDSTLPLNQWTYVTTTFAEFAATGNYQFMIRGFNGNNPSALTFYMDDLSLAEVELRP
ncbi:SwmB domain-containing protein [Persicitalea jodogahamensis]|uniref:PKD domain-containing protein n=1 Tax=Persicitalea jodogahamensis TaxID=402147 RepID=A0A8J3DA33_9BACT|nr:SwmB domain-containing protein [Persicitalea jodogahamensis]GHB74983.1 hypothetical protein GCM10007390_30860 [Persicitalea jodogahamensis]